MFIGVSYEPDQYHFSGSVGIDPQDTRGFDIFLTKLLDGYVLEVLTPEGEKLMQGLDLPAHETGKPARGHFQQHIYVPQTKLNTVMAAGYDNEIWNKRPRSAWVAAPAMWCAPPATASTSRKNVDISATKGRSPAQLGRLHAARLQRRGRRRSFPRGSGRSPAAPGVQGSFKYLRATPRASPGAWAAADAPLIAPLTISIVSIVNHLVADYEKTVVAPI